MKKRSVWGWIGFVLRRILIIIAGFAIVTCIGYYVFGAPRWAALCLALVLHYEGCNLSQISRVLDWLKERG